MRGSRDEPCVAPDCPTLFGDHSGLPRVIEEAARIDHRPDVAERFDLINLAGSLEDDGPGVQVHRDDVAVL